MCLKKGKRSLDVKNCKFCQNTRDYINHIVKPSLSLQAYKNMNL